VSKKWLRAHRDCIYGFLGVWVTRTRALKSQKVSASGDLVLTRYQNGQERTQACLFIFTFIVAVL